MEEVQTVLTYAVARGFIEDLTTEQLANLIIRELKENGYAVKKGGDINV
jgi:hypothetical protein